MATKAKAARVIQFTEIEQRFELVPLRWFDGTHPAVEYKEAKGYTVRVLKSETLSGANVSVTFDYFYLDADGNITEAPRGYARDYRPGRIPVEELDAAVARYAEQVHR